MTALDVSSRRRGELPGSDSGEARLFLALACVWPFLVIILYIFAFDTATMNATMNDGGIDRTAGQKLRGILDRVDIMGYGPTHPRVAVVVVGKQREDIVKSIESVYRNMDLDRLFVICAVMDGVGSDPTLQKDLVRIEKSRWHESTQDRSNGDPSKQNPRSKKIHTLFSKHKQGISASRADAVDFITRLEKKHFQAGIKSPDEDLILLLLQSGAVLRDRHWLAQVTSALIVPPPLVVGDEEEDPGVALKVANAISFGTESTEGKAVAFDYSFQPLLVDPHGEELAMSNGESYSTPALSGAATAMRLGTYRGLPAQDTSLVGEWEANLDLSLNLWLCGDGIDVLNDVNVEVSREALAWNQSLPPALAARFAVAWMDTKHQEKVKAATMSNNKPFQASDWELAASRTRSHPDFPFGLPAKCRSFSWYESEINYYMEVTQEDIDEAEARKARSIT